MSENGANNALLPANSERRVKERSTFIEMCSSAYFVSATVLAMILSANAGTVISSESLYEQVDRVTMSSDVLGQTKDFVVVKPEGYDSSINDWPVVYLFHGKGRTERSLVDDAGARATLQGAGFVTIMPDGDTSWYVDSPYGDYETYIEEVMALAESTYRISTNRTERGLTGWSMGGYGCMRFAERHTNDFSAVASMIGVIDYPSTGQGREVQGDESVIFGTDTNQWIHLNPINAATQLVGMAIHLITGDSDTITKTMNDNFDQVLTDEGIEHQYTVLSGGHDFDLVTDDALPRIVSFMGSTMAAHTNTLNYIETFESYASGFTMPGMNGWSAVSPGNAVVSDNAASVAALNAYNEPCGYPVGTTDHAKVLEISGTVANSFSMDANQTVWADMMLQVGAILSVDFNLFETVQAAIGFSDAGHPMVYHFDVAAGTNRWTEIPETTKSGWVRATLGLDYQSDYFQMKLDGILLTNALAWTSDDGLGSPGGSWFAMPNAANRMTRLVFSGEGANIDDLVVTMVDPFAAIIKSIEHFSGDVYRLEVDWPVGNQMVPSTSYPIKSVDLVFGSWGSVAHSTNGGDGWQTTNLDYSATEGSSKVIYLESAESTSFFGFGE